MKPIVQPNRSGSQN